MSRTRRAMVSSLYAYLQYAASIVLTIVLVPIVLAQVDVRVYGLWLACSDLLGYLGLLDFGVFGVLPWLVAEADGRGDEKTIRGTLANAFALAAGLGIVAAIVCAVGWVSLGALLHLTEADRGSIARPLLLLAIGAVLSIPLNVCGAALAGMQDVKFSGVSALGRLLLSALLTLTLLWRGWGLLALAVGTAVPAVLFGLLSVVRLRLRFPSLLRQWPTPSIAAMRSLARTSIGAWLGAFGWKLISMSNGLVIAAVGHPELVPLYSCTARLSGALLQMGWIIPDSGLVGLAQLHGERRPERLREVTSAMMRLHLIIAGGAATFLLAINPAFVSWWVSISLFGGHQLNVLLAAGLVATSITHALATMASVLGRRLEVGFASLANGVVQILAGFFLAQAIGFQGIALAAIVATAVTMLPVGLKLMAEVTGTPRRVFVDALLLWAARGAWPVAAAVVVGVLVPPGALWLAFLLWLPVGAAYIWVVRPLYAELPLDPRLRALLVRLRLVPVAAAELRAVEPVA